MEEKRKMTEKRVSPVKTILVHLFLFVSVFLAFLLRWAMKEWSDISADDILITLAMPVNGTSPEIVFSLLRSCLLPALLITAFAAVAFRFIRQHRHKRILSLCELFLSLAMLLTSGIVAYDRFEVGSFLGNEYSDFIDQNYVDPRSVSVSFPEKRNLILIYLESMETTYADEENGGAFPYNCIPELVGLAHTGEDFSGSEEALNGGHVLIGSTNTIKAEFAQSSGLPLKVLGSPISYVKSFFPDIVCMGDILNDNGYTQELLMGSESSFAGKNTFYTQHGNYRILDYNYARESGWIEPDYRVWWGYEDEKLFSFAKQELMRLSQEDRPFNFTLLTADTHGEDGYRCELCRDDFPNDPYANVFRCSSRQVSEFVQWLQTTDFYPNTTVLLVGDHLTMDKDFCENVSPKYDRKVFTVYLNAAAKPTNNVRRVYSTFDFFPTTLAALGAEIPGNRLGLGTNLFSAEETLCEIYGIDKQNAELEKRSHLIDELQIESAMDSGFEQYYNESVSVEKNYSAGLHELQIRFLEEGESDLFFDSLTLHVRDAANNELDTVSCQKDDRSMTAILDLNRYSEEDLCIAPEGAIGSNTVMLDELHIRKNQCYLFSNEIDTFLKALIDTDYAILISAKDEASEGLAPSTRALLSDLGLQKDMDGQFRSSYCAVIDHGTVLMEELGSGALELSGKLSDGTPYSVCSAGFQPESTEANHGTKSEISIDGVEYSPNLRGLNIAVYDTERHELVSAKCYDTHMKAESSTRLSYGWITRKWTVEIETIFPETSEDVELWVSEPDSSGGAEDSVIYTAKKKKDGVYQVSIKDASAISGKTGRIYIRYSDGFLYQSEEFPIDCEAKP